MSIKTYSLGAVKEVTGSKHILDVDGKQILIDCGAFQGYEDADKKNHEFDIDCSKLVAVVLTHAHYDHCGLLPVLIKKGYTGKIYSTHATRDLANIVMMDSARIQIRENSKNIIYSERDVSQTINRFVTLNYNQKITIAEGITLQLFNAGHIMGSAVASITVGDKNFLFSGDLGRKNKPIVASPDTDIPAPDYIYLESTYGNRLHEPTGSIFDGLKEAVDHICKTQGKLIIPSFAIERAQEIIYYLHCLMDQKKIKRIPIYIDSPMTTNVTNTYLGHPECYGPNLIKNYISKHKDPFHFGQVEFVVNFEESIKLLEKKRGPHIIIAADGMCDAGRIQYHLEKSISDFNSEILVVGYMAENSLGRKVLEGEQNVIIHGKDYRVNAKVEKLGAFSAHADYEEILEWLSEIDTSNLKKIFLVHGNEDSQEFLQNFLKQNGYNVEIVGFEENSLC